MMSENDLIESRRATCRYCGRPGIHVDTTAGEIVVTEKVVATVDLLDRWLMVEPRTGRLTCGECAE